jgi:hypothetical protein
MNEHSHWELFDVKASQGIIFEMQRFGNIEMQSMQSRELHNYSDHAAESISPYHH